MFKKQSLKLELISAPEMYRMIQPNVRGGICHSSVRYTRANYKYMGALYRPGVPVSHHVHRRDKPLRMGNVSGASI